jgi:FKBP-type peptidyl-prolyl cis-trans isomerase
VEGFLTLTPRSPKSTRFAAIDLLDEGVQKEIIQEGDGDTPTDGQKVTISYKGFLVERNWSPAEVVRCWLGELQGQEDLAPTFTELQIDGAKLLSDTFDEEFAMNELKISNKIKAKKLVMAAKRLRTEEFPPGTEFDSNDEFSFVVGAGKVIKGMEVGVSSMALGERARLTIRSDAGYGSDGVRRRNGETMVPPFATLCFDAMLQSIE